MSKCGSDEIRSDGSGCMPNLMYHVRGVAWLVECLELGSSVLSDFRAQ